MINMFLSNEIHAFMDEIYDIEEKISDQDCLELCSLINENRLFPIKQDNCVESDHDDSDDDVPDPFFHQPVINHPDSGIEDFISKMDAIFVHSSSVRITGWETERVNLTIVNCFTNIRII